MEFRDKYGNDCDFYERYPELCAESIYSINEKGQSAQTVCDVCKTQSADGKPSAWMESLNIVNLSKFVPRNPYPMNEVWAQGVKETEIILPIVDSFADAPVAPTPTSVALPTIVPTTAATPNSVKSDLWSDPSAIIITIILCIIVVIILGILIQYIITATSIPEMQSCPKGKRKMRFG